MSRFVLQPARILLTRLAPDPSKEVEEKTFEQMFVELAQKNRLEGAKLGLLKQGSYVGTCWSARSPGTKIVFVLLTAGGNGNIDFVLKADPSFPQRLISVYRVESAEYDAKVSEGETPEQAA